VKNKDSFDHGRKGRKEADVSRVALRTSEVFMEAVA